MSRYIRHTSLSSFGDEGQSKLQHASVLIVGLGGLGVPVVQYLNAMGVGTLGLVEQDTIAIHNLQRQVLYTEFEVGQPKLEIALGKLQEQNSATDFKVFDSFLTRNNALEIIQEFDLVIDATDNFASRYLINDACVILNKPFVYGALHAFEGQVSVFNYKGGPTYRCLFPNQPSSEEIPNCDENGVLGILPGIVGSLQALEAVKVLTDIGEVLSGKLLLYDGLTQSSQKINFTTNLENKGITALKESYKVSTCYNTTSISAEDFIALSEVKQLQIIDVRSIREFIDYAWKDSKNIPLQELENRLNELDISSDIYLLCQSGQRSKRAFELIHRVEPLASLFNVSGGLSNLKLHVGSN